MQQEKFSIKKRLQSFRYAFSGIKILLLKEHNARIHLFAALVVVIAGFILKISSTEWMFVSVAIGFVFVSEILNSTIEKICDIISPIYNEKIKIIKDLSAAAVLISAIVSVIIAAIIFLPKIF